MYKEKGLNLLLSWSFLLQVLKSQLLNILEFWEPKSVLLGVLTAQKSALLIKPVYQHTSACNLTI